VSATYLFATPLDLALSKNGYQLYKSKDKRYCFLPAPTAEFVERANYATAIPSLHSEAKWELGRKSPHGTWGRRKQGGVSVDEAGNIVGWYSERDRQFAHACGE
jgi:hypothetical protein